MAGAGAPADFRRKGLGLPQIAAPLKPVAPRSSMLRGKSRDAPQPMSTCARTPYRPSPPGHTLYMRPLPASLPALESAAGPAAFQRALLAGTLEGYFRLAQQFHTQADPAFCGLGSLVCALNALGIDPRRRWKGAWRWFSEELLDCCKSLEEVRRSGITLDEAACLARCSGASATVHRGDEADAGAFRKDLLAATTASDGPV